MKRLAKILRTIFFTCASVCAALVVTGSVLQLWYRPRATATTASRPDTAPPLAAKQARITASEDRAWAAAQARIDRFGPKPEPSAWDGTYRAVEEYLGAIVNDPDRLKLEACTPVSYVKRGWLVGCDWRGANGFGGMIRQSSWFVIRQGRVVDMLPWSAYHIAP